MLLIYCFIIYVTVSVITLQSPGRDSSEMGTQIALDGQMRLGRNASPWHWYEITVLSIIDIIDSETKWSTLGREENWTRVSVCQVDCNPRVDALNHSG